ncbi:MAG TPA: zinc ribbon domain-containing protein, partial [Blastocatellia bacterium]|nr:zinc ribbon domain-containing protein [Blastocatellia bacterium]
MSNCPRCGARNNANLDACRLCGTFLGIERDADSSVEKIDTTSPTVVVPVGDGAQQSSKGPQVIAPAEAGPESLACPVCHTSNEVGWAFCQHCGTRLPSGQVPPTADRKAPQDLVTVVVEADQLVRGAPEESPPPRDPSPASPPASAPSESSALTEEARVPSPVEVQGGLYCPNCGKQNIINNSYCSGCGGAIPVAETVAMASVSAPPQGRLRLIMEGGQEGDLFELKDETIVGRTSGDIAFPHDGFMSGR